MTDHDSLPRVPPLALPSPYLHFATPEPYVDSEEFRQRDKHRTSRELEPINKQDGPQKPQRLSFTAPQARPSLSTSSYRGRGRPRASEISTVPDSEGPDERNVRRYRLRRQVRHWYDPAVRFWTTQISVTIDEGQHRDHLALERTFLGYLRTSLACAMAGVIIAQLFRLQHTSNPNLALGFFVLGIPLAAIFMGMGIVVLLIGTFRFWRQQNAIVRGKVHAGGWEITAIMVLSMGFCTVAFVMVTAIDIQMSYDL